METVFNEGDSTEQQLLPGEIIGTFKEANQALIRSALVAHRWPSVLTLGIFDERIEQAPASVGPFFEREFFRDADTDIPVQVALDTVADATEYLAKSIKTIHPTWIAEANYSESFREETKTQLLGEERDAMEASARLCNSYMIMVTSLGVALYETPEIAAFMKRQTKRIERKEQAKKFSLIATAAFVGAMLAQRRRK